MGKNWWDNFNYYWSGMEHFCLFIKSSKDTFGWSQSGYNTDALYTIRIIRDFVYNKLLQEEEREFLRVTEAKPNCICYFGSG
jgi:hypothetical protein